jgi:hypothetical protein
METRLFIQFMSVDGEWHDSIVNLTGGFTSLGSLLSHLERKTSFDFRIGTGDDKYRIIRRTVAPLEEVLISD